MLSGQSYHCVKNVSRTGLYFRTPREALSSSVHSPHVAIITFFCPSHFVCSLCRLTSTSTCTEIGWSATARGTDDTVCSNSIVNGACSGAVTYNEAFAFCDAVGARLCTKTELATDEARNLGCALDRALVWTNNACGSGSMQTAYGSSVVAANGTCIDTTSTTTYNTRCCADTVVDVIVTTTAAPSAAPVVVAVTTAAPMPTPTAAPSAAVVVALTTVAPSAVPVVVAAVTTFDTSTSTCAEIGWSATARGTDDTVCSNSIVNGSCSGAVTYNEAFAFCDAVGARLCTKTELATDEARNLGCTLDRALVWTNNACGSGSIQTAYGSSVVAANGTCIDTTSTIAYNTRCCADTVVAVAVTTNAPSAAPVAAVTTNAPSATPIVVATTSAPSTAPVVAVTTTAPSASPVVAVNTNAPSAAPVVAVTTAAPSAAPVFAVTTAAPSAAPAAPVVTVTTAAPSPAPTSAPTTHDHAAAGHAHMTDDDGTNSNIQSTDDNNKETITIASASVAGIVAVGLLVGGGLAYRAKTRRAATGQPDTSGDVEMAGI